MPNGQRGPSAIEAPQHLLHLGRYDYDVDDSPVPKRLRSQALSWRHDPDESFSDWTIVVTSEDDNRVTMYHVHKYFLGVGTHMCEYFQGLFVMQHPILNEQNLTPTVSCRSIF